jgi:hypothetical protein
LISSDIGAPPAFVSVFGVQVLFYQGGHFAALQAPDLLVRDVREFYRRLR